MGEKIIHPIKTIYNFIVIIQILSFIVFIFYLIDSELDIVLPINISFTIPNPVPLSDDLVFSFNYDFRFNVITIFAIVIGMFLVYILSGLYGASFGISDEGSISIKQIITFVFKFFVLNLPMVFIFSKSATIAPYVASFTLFAFVIYFINLMIDVGSENNV